MATFGGENIFGTAVTMVTPAVPDGNGTRHTRVSGLLYAPSRGTLDGLEGRAMGYRDGQARTLVDTQGAVWPGVVLASFTPVGGVRQSPGGILFRAYEAVFEHKATVGTTGLTAGRE